MASIPVSDSCEIINCLRLCTVRGRGIETGYCEHRWSQKKLHIGRISVVRIRSRTDEQLVELPVYSDCNKESSWRNPTRKSTFLLRKTLERSQIRDVNGLGITGEHFR